MPATSSPYASHAGNAICGCAESLGRGRVTVCVDLELARRAEVFVANGYSSLSTQVVALRLSGRRTSRLFELRRFGGANYFLAKSIVL